jgi:predicted nucleotidyltransferase
MDILLHADVAAILTVLTRAGQPLSGRTIAALTERASQPTTSRLLRSMVASGLVEQVPGGYILNRDHLAVRALDALHELPDRLHARIAERVARWTHAPTSTVLFGSAARGEAGSDSDIDLLLVRPPAVAVDDDAWAGDVAELSQIVQRWTGNRCEVLEHSIDELLRLARDGDPIVDALRRDGVLVHGQPLDRILNGTP